MAISYPLTMPTTPGNMEIMFQPNSLVGISPSIFTAQQQIYSYPGQWWTAQVILPAMTRASAAPWMAFLFGLNGVEGTFMLGDSIGKLPRGTIAGTVTVGASATAGSTTLPLSGGTGAFALGDWLQIGTSLYSVIQVNSGSVDVFPKLRQSYSSGTSIIYNNAKGLFRLSAPAQFTAGVDKLYQGVTIAALEVL